MYSIIINRRANDIISPFVYDSLFAAFINCVYHIYIYIYIIIYSWYLYEHTYNIICHDVIYCRHILYTGAVETAADASSR